MSTTPTPSHLLQSLRLRDATLLVIGCIVGVGIFRTASPIASHVHSPSLILLLWVIGDMMSILAAGIVMIMWYQKEEAQSELDAASR